MDQRALECPLPHSTPVYWTRSARTHILIARTKEKNQLTGHFLAHVHALQRNGIGGRVANASIARTVPTADRMLSELLQVGSGLIARGAGR